LSFNPKGKEGEESKRAFNPKGEQASPKG